jgi:hypothetical protein
LAEAIMRDPISRTLLAFVGCQVLFALLLPLVLIPPPEGLAFDLYVFGLREAATLVVEAAAGTIVLFTVAVWIQRRFWLLGYASTVGLIGPALVLAPFFFHTDGITRSGTADKSALFFTGYLALAAVLGTVFWFAAVMERRDD